MRLTLRTMLAYLDDLKSTSMDKRILDPGDADELGQKIQESKFASELVQRIRNSTRRLRLTAPKPEGKGMGRDPNSVAEYLDNTLSPEHVPEFEKVCLESDVHLAEVASCHQILTLVLGEPAEVEHAIRERIYGVGAPSASQRPTQQPADNLPHLAGLLVEGAADPSTVRAGQVVGVAGPASPNSTFPLKSVAITLVLAFLLALVSLRALGEFNSAHPLWKLVAARSSPPPAAATAGGGSTAVDTDSASQTVTSDNTPDSQGTAARNSTSPASSSAAGDPSQDTALDVPITTVPDQDTAVDVATAGEQGSQGTSAAPPVGGSGKFVDARDAVTAMGVTGAEAADASSSPADDILASPPETAPHVGRYISEAQVLARFDHEEEAWHRLAADTPLEVGNDLIVLPTYRPQMLVKSGVKVTFAGASQFRMESPAETSASRLSMLYGRVILIPAADEAAAMTFSFGERQVTLRLTDMQSSAAVDVRRYLPPGADPETAAPELIVRIYGLSGTTHWHEDESAPEVVMADQLLTARGTDAPRLHSLAATPDWIQASELSPIDRRASQALLDHLVPDRPLIVSLMEQTDADRQRQKEVRALANHALVLFGVYDSILATFDDRGQRPYWDTHFRTLRFVVSQGSEPAARLQRIVEMLYGSEASTVFRLIRGYSPDQLAAGASEELVQLLGHPTMGVRVLASRNLKMITGMTHLYQPAKDPGQSVRTIEAWRRTEIAYKVPPAAFAEIERPDDLAETP